MSIRNILCVNGNLTQTMDQKPNTNQFSDGEVLSEYDSTESQIHSQLANFKGMTILLKDKNCSVAAIGIVDTKQETYKIDINCLCIENTTRSTRYDMYGEIRQLIDIGCECEACNNALEKIAYVFDNRAVFKNNILETVQCTFVGLRFEKKSEEYEIIKYQTNLINFIGKLMWKNNNVNYRIAGDMIFKGTNINAALPVRTYDLRRIEGLNYEWQDTLITVGYEAELVEPGREYLRKVIFGSQPRNHDITSDVSIRVYNKEARGVCWLDGSYVAISHSWGKFRGNSSYKVPEVEWRVPSIKSPFIEINKWSELESMLFDLAEVLGVNQLWIDWLDIDQELGIENRKSVRLQPTIFNNAKQVVVIPYDINLPGILNEVWWINEAFIYNITISEKEICKLE